LISARSKKRVPPTTVYGQIARAQRVFQHARLGVGPVEDREVARRQRRRQRVSMWPATNSASSRSVSPSNRTIGSPSPSSVNSRFGPPLAVLLDDRVGGGQDVAGRAVVALQLDDARARVVALEVEDVADVGAAPAVDRLVLVADDGDAAGAPRQQAHQPVLDAVRVLELVDQHVVEALRDLLGGGRAAGGELQHRQQRPPKSGRVGRRQPLLVKAVRLAHDVVEVVVGDEVGATSRVLGAIDRVQTCRTGNIRSGTLRSISTRASSRF
jgi:hypothetical protein